MAEKRDWREMVSWSAKLLKDRTGKDVAEWNRLVLEQDFKDEQSLRLWLQEQGVVSYPKSLLVWERFGYPHHFLATAEELIDAQYADRPHLRFQLMYQIDPWKGQGIACCFREYEIYHDGAWQIVQNGIPRRRRGCGNKGFASIMGDLSRFAKLRFLIARM